ncbi:MAG: hypothetical protein COV72_02025 [Candidatus Omnitrophica bacterium CG11_big_fil_rev_8_21_14_0_20_42_13]|uniref:Uncharacterized protein n=1 Tax=Candidatus Ghiorseimicrobium undicola TaxID=1974746 RepID=A0A2H0M1K9_9BACT|nr:MAG: hypothetical protein COV72_02025 [Candidatus Omnitrophica bacterium CG11_big_fil_rev_8_21_14_0_20_42_13]
MKDKRKKMLSNAIIFSASNYIATGLSFISSFVIRKVLGPMLMGLYSELALIMSYGLFNHLGMVNAMEREIPFYKGKNDIAKIEKIKKAVFYFVLSSASTIAVLLIAVSFFGGSLKIGLRFIALAVFLETIGSFYETLLQSYKEFGLWSKLVVIISIADIILKVFLTIKFGLDGLLTAMALSALLTIGLYQLCRGCRIDFRPKVSFADIKNLFKIGLPLFIFRIMHILYVSIDKLAIIFFLGRLQLGYYSIASMVYNYLMLLPKFTFRTIYPDFIEHYSRSEDKMATKNYFLAPLRIFSSFFPLLIGLVIIFIPFVVYNILPRFKEGIFAAQIIAVGAFFYSLIFTAHYLFIAKGKQKKLSLLYAIGVGISIILNIVLVKIFDLKINGVALAMLFSQAVFTTLLIVCSYRYYSKNFFEHVRLIFSLYIPCFWAVFVLFMLRVFPYGLNPVSFKKDILDSLLRGAILIFSCAPFVFHIAKREKLIQIITERFQAQKQAR